MKKSMLTMTEKALLGFAIILSVVVAGITVFPVFSYEVSLVTSPNRETFYIPAGQPFNITCKGSGDSAEKFTSLKWLNKDGEVIPEGIPGTRQEESHSLTLTFTDPKEDESGVYECIGVYKNKDTLRKSVSIFFHGDKPVFNGSFEIVTATENSSLEILCSADGESPITYEWYNQNEEEITGNLNSSNYVSIFTKNYANASFLIIPRVTRNHTGTYTCLASNRHGLSSKIFQLIVSSEGNDTTNETATFRDAFIVNVTTTSVKFAFDVTGPVNYIEVQFRENRSNANNFKQLQYGNDYEITDLIPAGLYYFKFRTSPSANGEWSKSYTVVLLPSKPEVIFRAIDSGTVKLEWSFKFQDRMRKTIDRHELTYYTVQRMGVNDTWKPSTCAITIQIPECTSSSYTLSGLSQDVYYEIQLRAHTSAGYSEPYSQKIFMSKRF